MKKIKEFSKSYLIGFIIGVITAFSISVIAATYFPSKDVTYDNKESELEGQNVQEAIDELYGICTTEKTDVGGIDVAIVESGDGLYKDEYEKGKYTYKGANPNNYITFNNETWRIISIDSDGTIKIIKNEHIGEMSWDKTGGRYGSNSWARPADLNTYLNGEYLMTITTNQDKIVSHSWNIGSVTYANNDLENQIQNENGTTWNGKIALPTVSEYLRADTNKEQCGNWGKYEDNANIDGICPSKNWMFNSLRYFVLLSPNNYIGDYSVISVGSDSVVGDFAFYQKAVSPSLYLSSDTILSGRGTESDPYIIKN